MCSKFCILDEKKTVCAVDSIAWAVWFGENMDSDLRRVALDDSGEVSISTVFVGLGPQPFESMVVGGPLDGTIRKSGSLRSAKMVHEELRRESFRDQPSALIH